VPFESAVSIPIAAVFVAVLILKADLHVPPGPILIVITPVVIVLAHSPAATYCTMLRVLVRHSPHIVPVHATHAVAIALLRSPIATDLNVLSAPPVWLTRLLRLLGGTLWLHRNSLGLVGTRSLSCLFGEYGH
jgi:hypothetical protein